MRRWLTVVVLATYASTWLVNRSLRRVEGTSMVPTLFPGDRVLTVPIAGRPPIGAIVVACDPRDPHRATIKRVAADAGERVTLLGDHAAGSTDSRTYGPVPRSLVTRRVVARVRPWRLL